MIKRLAALALLAVALPAAAQDYAIRLDTQYPQQTLQPLTFLQGATPRLVFRPFENGVSIGTDATNYYVRFSYATTATNAAFVATNSAYGTAAGTCIAQLTAAQTDTNGTFWFAALLMDSSGRMHYSGTGTLTVVQSTVTGAGSGVTLSTPLNAGSYTVTGQWPLSSIPSLPYGQITNAPWLTSLGSAVTNVINGGTGGATGSVVRSGADVTVTFPAPAGAASTNLSDYNNDVPFLSAETDPVWGAVSNTVTTGAALGTTALQAESDPAQTNLLDLAGTRPMTGNSVTLARDVKSRDAGSVGMFGAAFGEGNTIGAYSIGGGWTNVLGSSTIGGGVGNVFGVMTLGGGNNNVIGNLAIGSGYGNTIGNYGSVAGYRGKGALGSFVFSDSTDADFDRAAYTNWFSVRASGGTYFDTPAATFTGMVAAATFSGNASALTNIPGAQITEGTVTTGALATAAHQLYAPNAQRDWTPIVFVAPTTTISEVNGGGYYGSLTGNVVLITSGVDSNKHAGWGMDVTLGAYSLTLNTAYFTNFVNSTFLARTNSPQTILFNRPVGATITEAY